MESSWEVNLLWQPQVLDHLIRRADIVQAAIDVTKEMLFVIRLALHLLACLYFYILFASAGKRQEY
jgi:hypothetical protein